jgi:hypothetical protein
MAQRELLLVLYELLLGLDTRKTERRGRGQEEARISAENT